MNKHDTVSIAAGACRPAAAAGGNTARPHVARPHTGKGNGSVTVTCDRHK
jgi:hypothetical protein